jgi:hypothetical protein
MDWIDIGLHALGAVGIMIVGFWFRKPTAAVTINTFFWPIREAFQHNTIFNSPQSITEWVVPVVLGWLLWAFVLDAQEKTNG